MKKRLLSLLLTAAMTLLGCIPVIAGEVYDPNAIEADSYVLAGTCSTSYRTSAENRRENLRVASGNLNGAVIQPGEEFSVSTTMKPRTAANGYKMAGVYSGGRSVPGMGGGVCQVSSTVYNAAMNAGLNAKTRFPHSMPVSYLPLGQDAAIATGTKDLVLVNPYDTPVLMKAWCEGTDLTVEFYVMNSSLAGRTYKFYAVRKGGLSADSYRDTYVDGELKDTEFIAHSAYAPHL